MQILFQNSDFFAVYKDAGLAVHSGQGLSENLLDLLKGVSPESNSLPHRLDKETSGVQLVAKHRTAASRLAQEFENGKVEKVYRGLLRGNLEPSKGEWVQPLSDKSEGRKNPAGLAQDRKPCRTQYLVLARNSYFTDCQIHIATGRQHQIRKHAALSGHEIVGDQRYGDKKYLNKLNQIYGSLRMFLHCEKIRILDHEIVAPVPDEFSFMLKDQPASSS